jgi:PAS domain S-box-containing protein
MSEEPTQFQPTYALDAADAERPLSWMNLRKLLVLLVFMAAVPLMVVELLSSQREQDVELRRARESIDALADAIAVSNARMVEGVDQFLQALAASPVIAGNDLQACARYLQRILTLQPAYLNFGVIGPDGRLLCEATGNPASFNLGDRGYFQRALEGGGLVQSAITRSDASPGARRSRLRVPVVTENGVTKGVVYAALDLQALSDNLRAGRAMPGAAVLLVDAGGIVLASSGGDVAHLGRPLADSGLRQAVARRQVGVVVEEKGSGAAVLRAVRPVKAGVGRALYLAVAVPAETVIAPSLRRLHLRLAGILAIALGVAAAVWVGGYRLVVRPVERLITGLRHVEAGDYVQALNRTSSPLRELDELHRSLGSLAMALDAQRFERDQALAALSEREARYRELFKANPQVMFVYEIRSLRFLAVNEAALAFYGYSREEMLDMALQDVEPPGIQAPPQPSPGGAATERNLAASGPRRHQNKNGDIRLVERIASPTVFEGWPAELMMVTDVTDRLASEARVREGAERLEQRVAERTRELQLSIRELEAFSYSVSHDLRNPLGAVGMFGQMLAAHLGDTADEQARLYLARIEQGVRGMESLIDDLLTLAQVARAQLVMAPVDLTALCREVIEGLRLADPQRKVDVSLEDGLQCTGDAGLLRQMLVNLLGNAWKFTSRTPQARIRIGREPGATGPAAAFFVQDNGAGFDMKFAGRLFLPFERLHGDHDFPGTGIGLATVQRIVARHGGRIWAEAVPEQGATFHVEIGSHLPD